MSNEQIKENLRPMNPEPFDPKKRIFYAEKAVQTDDSSYNYYEEILNVKFEEWKGLKILDIGGTPNGNFARSAKDLGLDIVTYNPVKNPNQKLLENGHVQIVNRNKQVTILNPNSTPNTIYGLAQQMPFKPNSFDKIIGLTSIPAYLPNNINEYRETFNELLRILKPGGECILIPVMENIYNSPLFQKLLEDLKPQTKINFSEAYKLEILENEKETKFIKCLKMQILKL